MGVALDKNLDIQTLRVLFGRTIDSEERGMGCKRAYPSADATKYDAVRNAVLPLIRFAIKRGIKIVAEPLEAYRKVRIRFLN